VVTLKGTVVSDAARVRAVAVARSTEGVTRVVDQLVVK
jgi:osmotically-inducible protein OsmY